MATNTNMGKICLTCGDIGYNDEIVTCYKCKKTHEHRYCMKVFMTEAPQLWFCDECHKKMKLRASKKRVTQSSSKTVGRGRADKTAGGSTAKVVSSKNIANEKNDCSPSMKIDGIKQDPCTSTKLHDQHITTP